MKIAVPPPVPRHLFPDSSNAEAKSSKPQVAWNWSFCFNNYSCYCIIIMPVIFMLRQRYMYMIGAKYRIHYLGNHFLNPVFKKGCHGNILYKK